MSAPLVDFESENLIKAKRDEKRKARAIILQKAKEEHDKRERKKEQRKQRGEGTWMLPSVNLRLEAEEEKTKSKKHKKDKKKKKKHKKEKKHKHRSKDPSSSSDEDSEDEESEWVEKDSGKPALPASSRDSSVLGKKYGVTLPPPDYTREGDTQHQQEETPAENRQDWMSLPFMTATFSRDDIRKEKQTEKEKDREEAAKMLMDNPGQTVRELNPFWKDGGTGLPEEDSSKKHSVKAGVGDGGVGWLRKAFKRVKEMSEESGRSIEDLAAHRWGSLDKYYELLAAAEGVSERDRRPRRREDDQNRNRHRQRDYGRDGPMDWKSSDGGRDDRQRYSSGSRDNQRERYAYRDGDRSRGRDDKDSAVDGEDCNNGHQYRGRGDRRTDADRKQGSSSSARTFMKPSDSDDRSSQHQGSVSGSADMGDRSSHHGSGSSSGGTFMKPSDTEDRSSHQRRSSSSGRTFMKPSDTDDRSSHHRGPASGKTFMKPLDTDDRSSHNNRKSTSGRTFMKPSDMDDRSSRSTNSLSDFKGKFKKPGDDSFTSRNQPSSSSSRTSSSTNSSIPSWKKSFKKPGELSESNDTMTGNSSTSSAPNWKKPDSRNTDSKTTDSKNTDSRQALRDDKHRRRKDHHSSSSSGSSSGSSGSSSEDDESGNDERRNRSPTPPPPPPPARILSEAEMNQLGAKLVKAELMGNEALAQKIKSKLESARQANASQPIKRMAQPSDKTKRNTNDDEDDDVLLTRTDRSGQSWPLPDRTVPAEMKTGRRKKKQKVATHGEAGQRERYFGDDDELDLKTLVQREKMNSAEDQHKLFNRMAAKSMDKLNNDFSLDDMFVSSAAKKESTAQIEERERSRAIAEHRRLAASLSKCPLCVDSPDMKKHLMVALGMKVYLCLPATKSLTEGHCLIVPMQHSIASTGLDEDIWSEIQIFRKGLTRMFEDQGSDAIFLETCMNPKKQRHMCIECIPVPKETGDLAPIYFKKAIQESESEWMENKKLIDTANKGIRKAVPAGFPYFSVDFGLDGGFAHIIEDEQLFPHYFGKEIIGGMLDVEPQLWRRPHKQNFDDQRKKVLQFADWWKPFDWTQRIER